MDSNVYLIGYRCSGKTTLGRALSRHLGRSFVDTDEEIVRQSGKSIREMVREAGWEGFRAAEGKVIAALCRRRPMVVATGGGVVLDARNVAQMRASGVVVWLRSRAETIKKWIALDPASAANRPALSEAPLADEIDATLAQRTPLYRAASDFVLDTDEFDVQALVLAIAEKLKTMGIG
jgi:shikimate kinase